MTSTFKFGDSNYSTVREFCERWTNMVRFEDMLNAGSLGYRRMITTDLGSGLIKPHQPRTSVERTLCERMEASLIKVCIANLKDKVRGEYKDKLAQALAHIKDIRNAKCYQNNEGTGLVVEFEAAKLTIELGKDAFRFDVEGYYNEIDSHLREPVRKVVELYNKDRIADLALVFDYKPESKFELILVVQFHGDNVPPARHVIKSDAE